MRRGAGIVQRMLQHWTHQTSAAAFECWHVHALKQKHMEQVCTHMVQKMLNHSLDVAMMTWKDHARKQRRATAVCARVVGHWLHRVSAHALETWRDHTRRKARGEGVVRRVLAHSLHRTAAGARCFFFFSSCAFTQYLGPWCNRCIRLCWIHLLVYTYFHLLVYKYLSLVIRHVAHVGQHVSPQKVFHCRGLI